MKKSVLLILAILLGAIITQASVFSYLIYYLLMFMLFFPFLEWEIHTKIFKERRIYIVLLLNIIIGLSVYFILKQYNNDLAIAALLIGIAPTATACPSIISYLKGRVDFSVASVMITNLFMSLFIPIVIYKISNVAISISTIFFQTLILILIPLISGQIIHKKLPRIFNFLIKFKQFGFYTWLVVCFLAVSKASFFIQNSNVSLKIIILVSLVSGIICLLNFNIGKIFGGENLSLEMSQSLGQKNTMLAVWIGLTYFNPLITLGPIFYLIWHNLYNAYQLAFYKKL